MIKVTKLILAAVVTIGVGSAAYAGEVTGNDGDTPLAGASICQFSGLNDNPDSTNPANPGGRTQSFGQNIAKFGADPRDPEHRPGILCNPNNLPWKPIGHDDR